MYLFIYYFGSFHIVAGKSQMERQNNLNEIILVSPYFSKRAKRLDGEQTETSAEVSCFTDLSPEKKIPGKHSFSLEFLKRSQ